MILLATVSMVASGSSTRKKDLQMLVLKSKEQIMENVCRGDRF